MTTPPFATATWPSNGPTRCVVRGRRVVRGKRGLNSSRLFRRTIRSGRTSVPTWPGRPAKSEYPNRPGARPRRPLRRRNCDSSAPRSLSRDSRAIDLTFVRWNSRSETGAGASPGSFLLPRNAAERVTYRHGAQTLSVIGHRAYLVVNNVLHAIDMFDPKSPTVLWRRSLVGSLAPTAAGAASRSDTSSILGENELTMLQQAFGLLGSTSPNDFVSASDQIAFRQDSSYAAVDPFSGDLLWSNSARPTNGHFFGNNAILFAQDRDAGQRSRRVANAAMRREPVHTLSAEDGRPVRSRMIPAVRNVLYMGNRALIRHADGQHLEVGRLRHGSRTLPFASEALRSANADLLPRTLGRRRSGAHRSLPPPLSRRRKVLRIASLQDRFRRSLSHPFRR